MPDRKADYLLQQQLETLLAAQAAEPPAPAPLPKGDSTLTVNGGTVYVSHGPQHITVHAAAPPPALISEAQSGLLKGLVRKIGRAERLKNPAYHDAKTWTRANAVAGVDHHRDIPRRDFDRVKGYLEDWLGRLGKST